jgi:hypothetical protein
MLEMRKLTQALLTIWSLVFLFGCSKSVDNSEVFEPEARALAEAFVLNLHEKSAAEWQRRFYPELAIKEQDLSALMNNSLDLGKPAINQVKLSGKNRAITDSGVVFSYTYLVSAEYPEWLGVWEVVVLHNKQHYLGGFCVKQMVAKAGNEAVGS